MTRHIFVNTACGMTGWLTKALIGGLAFGIGLNRMLAIAALPKYAFDHSSRRVN